MARRVVKNRFSRGRQAVLDAERLEPRQLLTVAPGSWNLPLRGDDVREVAAAPAAATVAPSGDPRIDAVLGGLKWGVTNITYSFYEGGGYYGSESSPTPVSSAVRESVRAILSTIISPLVNLTFTEVADSSSSFGMIRYLCSMSADYAYAYYPSGSDLGGDVVLRTSFDVTDPSNTNSFRNGIGSHGFQTLIHETCHALGLKHPGDYNGGGTGDPPYLPLGEDNWDNSLMSYNFSSGKEPASPMAYDVLALGYIYGAKTATRAADTTYVFTATDVWSAGDGSSAGAASKRSKNTLWDGGGTDTVDLSKLPAAASGYRIDIGAGGWITPTSSYNTAKYNATTGSPTTFSTGTTFSATDFGTRLALTGTTIENVVVSGSSDSIFVNAAANRVSGYTPGVVTGADVITGTNQADTLDLSGFLESDVTKTQVGNDLVLNLGGSTGTVTVKDYYALASASRVNIVYATPPSITVAPTAADKAEGTGVAPTAFTFTVTRAGGLTAMSTVAWAVTGSGVNPADAADFAGAVLPSGSVSFAVGESSKTITINVAADATIESDEGFAVTLTTPAGGTLGAAFSAVGTIRNDDFPAVTIATAAADRAEGTGGPPTAFTFTITRQPEFSGPSTVAWAVTGSGENPAEASDFAGGVLPSGSVSFAAGETAKTITVNVSADALIEADEMFTVTLSSPTGATLGARASATGTIRNDDFPGVTIAAADADREEGTSDGFTAYTFTITRQPGIAGTSTVAWAVTGSGSRPADAADFAGGVLPSGTVSFAAGETTRTITVSVKADAVAEADETFMVVLSALTNVRIGSPSSAVGTIRNDDYRSRISIAATDAVKREGDIGRTPFTFTLSRTGSLVGEVSVPWAVAGSGDMRADRFDFIGGVLPKGTIRIAAGRPTASITVNVLCDRVAEFDEEFTVTLGSPLGGFDGLTPGAFSVTGTIKNDDPGTPRPAAAMPIQGQAVQGQVVAGLAAKGALATAQSIAAQAFATLADSAGSSGTSTAKRIGVAPRLA